MASTTAHVKLVIAGLALSSLTAIGCAAEAPTAPAPKYGNGPSALVPAPQASAPNPDDMIVFRSSTQDATPATAPTTAPGSAPAMSLTPTNSAQSGRLVTNR